jgi:hypothetical protein
VAAAAVAEVADVVGRALPFQQRTGGRAGPERQQQAVVGAVDESLRVRRAETLFQLLPEQTDQTAVHGVEHRVLDGRLPVPGRHVRDPFLHPRLRLPRLAVERLRATVAEQRGEEDVAFQKVAGSVPQRLDAPGQDRLADRVRVGLGSAESEPPAPPGGTRPPLVPAGDDVIPEVFHGPVAERFGLGR